jgi:uncharacterized protein YegL
MRRLVVAAVLDKSGSMEDQKQSVIRGYNEYLGTVAKEPAEVRMSRTHFDDEVTVEHGPVPLVAAPRLTDANYQTAGNTALRDGIGETIRRIEREARKEDKVVVFVMTDGDENWSRLWSEEALKAKVEEKQAQGWKFIIFGANMLDVEAVGREMGFLPGDIHSFEATEEGFSGVFGEMAETTVKLLTDGTSSGPIRV